MNDTDLIPEITCPLGRYWRQPPRDAILVDDKHALMTRTTFDELPEYSASTPSGVYPGKMWRREYQGRWYLRWFGSVPDQPELCSNNQREIILC